MSSTSPSVFASVIGLWSRDAAVMRRELLPFVLRVVANPLLTVFVFTYVLPKSGQVMPTAAGAGSFATVLVPGLVAVAMMFTAIRRDRFQRWAVFNWQGILRGLLKNRSKVECRSF